MKYLEVVEDDEILLENEIINELKQINLISSFARGFADDQLNPNYQPQVYLIDLKDKFHLINLYQSSTKSFECYIQV